LFIARSSEDWQTWSYEQDPTAIAGHPDEYHATCMAIMNQTGSGRLVRVRQVRIIPVSPSMTVLNDGTLMPNTVLQSVLLGAVSEGDVVTPIPADTAAGVPPAVVVGYRYPGNYVISNVLYAAEFDLRYDCENAFRFFMYWHGQGQSLLAAFMTHRNASVQPIILAEGESYGLYTTTSMIPGKWTLQVIVSDGVREWIYSTAVTLDPNRLVFAVTNGVGSGVTLQVLRVMMAPGGFITPSLYYNVNQFTIESIAAMRSDTGDPVVPIGMSTTEVMPASVLVRRNAVCALQGYKVGGLVMLPRRRAMLHYGPLSLEDRISVHRWQPCFESTGQKLDIVLREGNGLGIFNHGYPGYCNYDFEMEFEVTGSAGGGGGTFVS